MKPHVAFWWLTAFLAFAALTRTGILPFILKNPNWKTFWWLVAATAVSAIVAWVLQSSEPPKQVTRY